jgi:hypothetical protein
VAGVYRVTIAAIVMALPVARQTRRQQARQGEAQRGLAQAEQEAARRGCHDASLDTTSFQALPFYLKHGCTLWGQLDDFHIGHSRYFLKKAL